MIIYMNNMKLNLEQQLLISACRITFDSKDEIKSILDSNSINWGLVIQYACKNKVLGLLHNCFLDKTIRDKMPKYFLSLLDDFCSCIYLRNEEKFSELENICDEMSNCNIKFVVVKGGYLIDNVYRNRKIRATNDIDALIRREDIKEIDKIMRRNGYKQGEYDPEDNLIIESNRDLKMLYKLKMYNLLPYIKINNDIPKRTVIFDLSHALDFTLDALPVGEMLALSIPGNKSLELLPAHFFVHLCCHHYREASNVAWILIGKDLNLIKFCDVREFVLRKMDSNSIQAAIQFAKKYRLEKALYFTIYFTREIYNDGYETEILKALDIDDESFLYQFGEKDYNELQTRKKDFWTSLFSDNNRDEITAAPKYENLIEGDV